MSTPAGEPRTIEIADGEKLVLYDRQNERAWIETDCFVDDVSDTQ